MIMKELPEIHVHNVQMRVMGIAVDARVNYMFSISESGYLIVTDLNDTKSNQGKFVSSQVLNTQGLKALIHDNHRNVLFVASGEGDVFILNSITREPQLITKIKTDQAVCIRGLTRSISLDEYWSSASGQSIKKGALFQNFLMASDMNGYITIFDIGNPGKEK
mmetsp:Transcript_17681/g.29884  ORF Transcript_17681/g.29884 Transcript_17681/m.29884 type:complete len:163 (+) Transcript_17681:1240-1728(+)